MVMLQRPPSGKRVVTIGGCIAKRDGEAPEKVPAVDAVFGTSALASLPVLHQRLEARMTVAADL